MSATTAIEIPRIPEYTPYDFEKRKADLQNAYAHFEKGAPIVSRTVAAAQHLQTQITSKVETLKPILAGLQTEEQSARVSQSTFLKDTFESSCQLIERVNAFVQDLAKAKALYDPAPIHDEHIALVGRLQKGMGTQLSRLVEESHAKFAALSELHGHYQSELAQLTTDEERLNQDMSAIFTPERVADPSPSPTADDRDWIVIEGDDTPDAKRK